MYVCMYVCMYVMCVVHSNDRIEIFMPRINESTSPSESSSPVHNDAATNTAPPASEDNADIRNESAPLLDNRRDVNYTHMSYGEPDEEHITFGDIPMPGLWKEDKPGKNIDRIIILLFLLLASMIVVSVDLQ